MSSTANLKHIVSLPAPESAPQLLGQRITHESPEGLVSGTITEVEAYQEGDQASHTFNGKTARTSVMFGPAGQMYVYFTYGMHWCCNVVVDEDGKGSAVLIRAVEIDEGVDLAWQRRYKEKISTEYSAKRLKDLSNGPAKFAQAFGIGKSAYGVDLLTDNNLYLSYEEPTERKIVQTPRIGISKAVDVPWRWLYK